MSKIRSENTQIERLIYRELRRKGIYFQKHYKLATGKPDIALPRKKKAIFIDGDFWHGYQFSKHKDKLPKKYWFSKIEGNIKRDKRNRARLRNDGWQVLRIWEHEVLKKFDKTITKVIVFLEKE